MNLKRAVYEFLHNRCIGQKRYMATFGNTNSPNMEINIDQTWN